MDQKRECVCAKVKEIEEMHRTKSLTAVGTHDLASAGATFGLIVGLSCNNSANLKVAVGQDNIPSNSLSPIN